MLDDDKPSKGKGKAKDDKAARRAMDAGLDAKWMSLEGASKVDLVADFRSAKVQEKEGGACASSSVAASPGLADGAVEKAKYEMPEGVQLMGGETIFEEQEDGSQALLVPESSFVKLSVNASPWALAEDGKLHNYTIIMAIRIDMLPSTTLPLFNGGPPPPQGEKVENVQVFKNGGVGALNDMGTQVAARATIERTSRHPPAHCLTPPEVARRAPCMDEHGSPLWCTAFAGGCGARRALVLGRHYSQARAAAHVRERAPLLRHQARVGQEG